MLDTNINKNHFPFYGTHLFGEFWGVDRNVLNSLDLIIDALNKGIEDALVNCEGILVKKFNPEGISIVVLLSESHISIHTYPENNAAFFDVFTCGVKCKPDNIMSTLEALFNAKKVVFNSVNRGMHEKLEEEVSGGN